VIDRAMPGVLGISLSTAEAVTLALVVVLAVLVAIMGYRAWQRSRVTPEERERQRRAMLVALGKISDATVVEIRDDLVFYCYDVRGVEYTASQDVSNLRQYISVDLANAGPVSVKYDARNPANSIVLAEEWSGIRASRVR
jgi:hypothetical protein